MKMDQSVDRDTLQDVVKAKLWAAVDEKTQKLLKGALPRTERKRLTSKNLAVELDEIIPIYNPTHTKKTRPQEKSFTEYENRTDNQGRKACNRCGSTDHLIRDCPRRPAPAVQVNAMYGGPQNNPCWYCQEKGHYYNDCPKYQADLASGKTRGPPRPPRRDTANGPRGSRPPNQNQNGNNSNNMYEMIRKAVKEVSTEQSKNSVGAGNKGDSRP